MSTNDGGPAFPVASRAIGNSDVFDIGGESGMSLRDWFAGQIIARPLR